MTPPGADPSADNAFVAIHAVIAGVSLHAVLLAFGPRNQILRWMPLKLVHPEDISAIERGMIGQRISLRLARWKVVESGLLVARQDRAADRDLFDAGD